MCYDDTARPPAPSGDAGPARGEDIVLTAADGNRCAAYAATPDAPARAQILIFPDVRGLHIFYKELALRFAEQGIAALAIDYFGRTAGLTPRDDSFDYGSHLQQMQFDTFEQDVAAALAHLHSGDGSGRATFTVGFCMGGTLSFLTGTRQSALSGVIGFYAGMTRSFGGTGTLLERAAQIKYPALGLFGGADQSISAAQVESFDRELDKAGVKHEIITYPGAPHSFFDRHQEKHAAASADAWARVLQFIGDHCGAQKG